MHVLSAHLRESCEMGKDPRNHSDAVSSSGRIDECGRADLVYRQRCLDHRAFMRGWSSPGSCWARGTKANPAAHRTDNRACTDPSYPYCRFDGAMGGEPGRAVALPAATRIASTPTGGACPGRYDAGELGGTARFGRRCGGRLGRIRISTRRALLVSRLLGHPRRGHDRNGAEALKSDAHDIARLAAGRPAAALGLATSRRSGS